MNSKVYDKGNDKEIRPQKVPINDKDREFLKVLYDAESPVTTMEMRNRTGLHRNDIMYRYNKFARERYVEIVDVRQSSKEALNPQVDDMLESELTEKGRKLMDQGLIGNPQEEYVEEEVVLNKDEYENLVEQVEQLETRVASLNDQVDTQNDRIRDHQDSIENLLGWRSRVDAYILACKFVVQNKIDVDWSEYLEHAREQLYSDDS